MPHKLAPRSSACIFLGYSPHHKGYRCMDLTTHRIIISRHVIFDESTFPFASSQQPSAASYDFLDDDDSPLVVPRLRLPRAPPPLHLRSTRHHRRLRPHRHLPHPRRLLPCIARVAPPASASHPVSGLTCMLLSAGTLRFQLPHVLLSRILTGSML